MPSSHKDNADTEFVSAIFETYGRKMLSVAKRFGPESQAEDNVQESLLHLLKHLDLLRRLKPSQQTLYIVTTVKYTTMNHNKFESRRKKREAAAYEEPGGITHEEKVELYTALVDLPERERDILLFHYLWGYSYKEIATLMGIRPNSVGAVLRTARRHALRLLKGGDQVK